MTCWHRIFVAVLAPTAVYATPIHLRCEHLTNPLGMDALHPVLSWQSDNTERNWHQSAYQILVASSTARLSKPDVWDSGKRNSAESNGIVYRGPKTRIATALLLDGAGLGCGRQAGGSYTSLVGDEPAGKIRLERENGSAARIRNRKRIVPPMRWVGVEGVAGGQFRLNLDLAEKPRDAVLLLIAHGAWKASINGHAVAARRDWQEVERIDIGDQLVTGNNSINVAIAEAGKAAGLAALVKITHSDGTVERIPTDRWEVRTGVLMVGAFTHETWKTGGGHRGIERDLPSRSLHAIPQTLHHRQARARSQNLRHSAR
jgi:alpha-L-rhamnosidase